MSSDSEQSAQAVAMNGFLEDRPGDLLLDVDVPATPQDGGSSLPSPQPTSMPPTEAPNSPMGTSVSFRSEIDNEATSQSSLVPSSLTPPPPSSQLLQIPSASQSGFVSPPATCLPAPRRDDAAAGAGLTTPTHQQVAEASAEELRNMLYNIIAEHSRLKMEATHHKMQNVLLNMQAQEDANRAAVEHEMTRREVQALQQAECARQARRDISTATETAQAKYLQLEAMYKQVAQENQRLNIRLKGAKKVIEARENEIATLAEQEAVLLNRIRENREHFHILCSPGGMFHGATTPKAPSPQQPRGTPRQTAKAHRDHHGNGNFAVLLEALSQDNNSTPSTPVTGQRPSHRAAPKHTRNVQSMSSLPTTPMGRSKGGVLLPSVDLVPQTEPPQRNARFYPESPSAAPRSRERARSRESTISADNEELARQAIQSVTASFGRGSQISQPRRESTTGEEMIFESQASQAASEMLRRDARESFEVASSVGNSRDATPGATDKSAKLQAKIFGPLNKSGMPTNHAKRKFSSEGGVKTTSPTKKLREAGGVSRPVKMAPLPRGIKQVLTKAPTDVVILSSLRTPICRSYKGQLKDAYPEELLSVVLKATLDNVPQLDKRKIEDVCVGVVLNELGGSKAARMALNHVGFDTSSTSLYTTNRACASSLQAIVNVANQIKSGEIEVGIGAGMESMTRNYGSRAIPQDVWPALKESQEKDARDCVMSMGITSENVSERYGVNRRDQDELAVESHARASRAQDEGRFDKEIVKVKTRFQEVDKAGQKVGEEKEVLVERDDGIRKGVDVEKLAKLKPAFKEDGKSTAGNSSQVSDGAAATLLMRRSTATALGLGDKIMGKFLGAAVVGCKPDEMGIGPMLAIPKVLERYGLKNEDVDRWEINEAFASQALYCVRALGLEKELVAGKVNPDGGAIALGHPLGATGARMVATLMHGLERTGGEVGVVSMCIGTGMGMAGVFVRE
ncbi:Thiolase, N-terminal domain-containing protein [Podospora fimiseda]|uniref:acetyl-CoA C-acyltransferase n=1 Tax=Podospora fimiseda TaxID=252190 RepID=A0AAN7BLW7_9PEZI|nr:Thiolase, N-terminal domain-containing protein [Podospora fimiseda]